MKLFTILFFVLSVLCGGVESALATDWAFYTKGNHLIPLESTTIALKKERLILKMRDLNFVEVTVDYEFFNPGPEQMLKVGFEAILPNEDKGYNYHFENRHPNITHFTVLLEDENIDVQKELLSHSIMDKTLPWRPLEKNSTNSYPEKMLYYAYWMNMPFKNGLNKVQHTYTFQLRSSIASAYNLIYLMQPACSWANKRIDEFSLVIDFGDFESFRIQKTFFKKQKEWKGEGVFKIKEKKGEWGLPTELYFYPRTGVFTFQKKNFIPEGDIIITSGFIPSSGAYRDDWNRSIINLPMSINDVFVFENYKPKNSFERKVLYSLPFARRGFVFKDRQLAQFFKKTEWYFPDPKYQGDIESLTETEKKWIERWNQN